MTRYKVGEDTYTIPSDKVEEFLIEFPDAVLLEDTEESTIQEDIIKTPQETTQILEEKPVELPEVKTPEIKDIKVKEEKPEEDKLGSYWEESIFTPSGIKDYFNDLIRAGKEGWSQSDLVDPSFDLYKQGSESTDEEIVNWIDTQQSVASKNMGSAEMKEVLRISEEAGGGMWGFIKGAWHNPSTLSTMLVSSIATQLGSLKKSDEVLAAGGAGAAAGATAGTFVLPVLGTKAGAVMGTMAGSMGAMETGLTFAELLQEEIEGELTKEKVRAILENPEKLADLKNKSLGRGATIAAIELGTMGLAKGVGGKIASAGFKPLKLGPSPGLGLAAAGGIEVVGGGTGEIAGRFVAGQEMDAIEIGFEAFAGLGSAPITMGAQVVNINTNIDRMKITNALKDTQYKTISEAFRPESPLTNAEIQIAKLKNSSTILDQQVNERVKRGDITKEEGNKIKLNFRETQGALNQVKALGFDVNQETESINLLKEKKRLVQKIDEVGDVNLTMKEKARVDEINIALQEVSTEGVRRGIRQVEGAIQSAGLEDISIKSFKDTKAIDTYLKDTGKDATVKYSGDQGIVIQYENGNQEIIINEDVAAKDQAVNVAGHEFLHALLYKTIADTPDAGKRLGDALFDEISKIDLEKVLDSKLLTRLNQYTKTPENVQGEEVLTLFSDAVATGDIKFNENVFTKVGDLVRSMLQSLGVKVKFNNGRDVYNFIKDYNKSLAKSELTTAQQEVAIKGATGELITPTKKAKETTVKKSKAAQEYISMENENLVEMINMEGVLNDTQRGAAINALIEKNPIIYEALGYNIKKGDIAPIDIRRAVEDELLGVDYGQGILKTYKPNESKFSTYLKNTLSRRKEQIYKKAGLDENKFKTTSIDSETAPQIAATDDTTGNVESTNIAREDKVTKKVLSKQLGFDKVDKAIAKLLKDPNFKIPKTYKSSAQITPKLIAELFGVNPEQYVDAKKSLTKTDVIAARTFIGKNPAELYAIIPLPATEQGKSTGMSPKLLNAIYGKAEARADSKLGKSKQGLKQRENMEKPPFDQKAFIKIFTPDKIMKVENQTAESGIIKALMKEVEKAMVNQAIRLNPDSKLTQKETQTLGEGRSRTVASKAEGRLKQGKETIEGFTNLANKLAPELGDTVIKLFKPSNIATAGVRVFGYNPDGSRKKMSGAVSRGYSFISSLANFVKRRNITKNKFYKKELSDLTSAIEEGKIYTTEQLEKDIYRANPKLKDIKSKKFTDLIKRAVFATKKLTDKKGLVRANEGKTLLLNAFKEAYNKDKSLLPAIKTITYDPNANNHTFRKLATLINIDTRVDRGYEEHMQPFKAWNETFIEALELPKKQWDEYVEYSNMEYNQEGVTKDTQRTLDQPTRTINKFTGEKITPWQSKFEYHPLLANHIKEALSGKRKFSEIISSDIRMFNEYKFVDKKYKPINPNFNGRAKKYNVEVPKKYQENPIVVEKQGDLIYNVLLTEAGVLTGTKAVSKKLAKAELNKFLKLVPTIIKASKKNEITFGKKIKDILPPSQQVEVLKNYDEAANKGRSLKTPEKGISVFDFDDTLARTNSKVLYELPNGKTGELSATEFAVKSKALEDQGALFDFSEFSKVIEGKKGPLANLALKRQGKFGSKDIFILTARPQESAQAIHEFLKGIGLEIPIKNITGLENGTPAAKANWVASKAAKGYNNFYFADDAMKNVKAVKEILDQIDVKSKVQQAKFSKSENLNKEFNIIIEKKTGLGRDKQYSPARAKTVGANKGKFNFWIPYSAEDFVGLIYPLLSKGKEGDVQMAWFKKNLLDPFNRAENAITEDKITVSNDFKELKKQFTTIPKTLKKEAVDGFTYENALRVYLWDQQGDTIPGLAKKDIKELTDFINKDTELKIFADELIKIQKGKPYPAPTDTWLSGTLTTDVIGGINTTNRAEYLQEWQENIDIIFSPENMNKLEATYGTRYVESLKNMLTRMKKGSNKVDTGNRVVNEVLDWVNNSVGAIMFLNTRSAVLQTISSINFINWSDNNVLKAGKAFANQKQYWKDFMKLFNSDFLVARRKGLKINVTESEIADAAEKGSVKGVISMLLKKGFVFTQVADSFAIASGGATFYRNRLDKLIKDGMSKADAEKQAFLDFYEVAEESQQSSRTDRISMQQASAAGRVILAFGNTPMQYGRLMKKAFLDLKNGRGDYKSNISKIVYYAVIQNIIFNAIQNALFVMLFDDDDEIPQDKAVRTANGMMDSILRGLGIGGAAVSTVKNIAMKIAQESDKKSPKYEDAAWEMLDFSPPISSKVSKVRSAGRTISWNKKEIMEKGFSLDNPAYLAGAQVLSAGTNIPLDRVIKKGNNIADAVGEESEVWQKIALLSGWSMWELETKKPKVEMGFGKRKKIDRKKIKRKVIKRQ